MKKWVAILFSIFASAFLIVGCSGDSNSMNEDDGIEEVDEEVVVISISEDEESNMISEKVIKIEDGDYLMDVMKDNFNIEEEDGFIHAIDEVAPAEGEERAWIFFVNGEMSLVGAEEYELSTGDYIVFDLQAWE